MDTSAVVDLARILLVVNLEVFSLSFFFASTLGGKTEDRTGFFWCWLFG